MPTVTIEEAQTRLAELIGNLLPGESLVITRDQKPIANVTAVESRPKSKRQLGTMKGTILSMAPDFDAPLEDFKEYME